MDRYYTPDSVARKLMEKCSFSESVALALDPSCGGGALLSAAEEALGVNGCVGIDMDRPTIRSLRRKKPHWTLSVANLLCDRSVKRSSVGKARVVPDLLLLNPPFSQSAVKFTSYRCSTGEVFRVGRAMRFLLQAIELFKPSRGVIAIVPESLLFSELDESGRGLILSRFEMREIAALKSTTFKGARVRTVAVELKKGAGCMEPSLPSRKLTYSVSVELERGGLPVHLSERTDDGVPFIHSTDLLPLAKGKLPSVEVKSGRIARKGWILLLPRVGVPINSATRAVYLSRTVRLSDCVLGLWCEDRSIAREVEGILLWHWESLVQLYRGTGARYVTVARLKHWLDERGVVAIAL